MSDSDTTFHLGSFSQLRYNKPVPQMNVTWCYTITQIFIWLPQKQMTKITNMQTDNVLL